MKRESGFSLLELMVSVAILVLIVAATLSSLNDALHANEAVMLLADMQQNLRAGMNFIVKDLIQAGGEIPTGGIPIPSGGGGLPINRPSPPPPLPAQTFPAGSATISAISPGPFLGPVLMGQASDILTILYADNTLPLNLNPINSAANPVCNGNIGPGGAVVTFDIACTPLNVGNISVQPGDLIMFSNAIGNALQTVTGVNGQQLIFARNDAFVLNQRADPQGTIIQIQNGAPGAPNGTYPPTTATRIWMITYYIDNVADPARPQLMRQVNFNPATPVGEVMENLQVSYDIVDGVTNPASLKSPVAPDSNNQIRKVNMMLAARSDARYSQSRQFFRDNLLTQVSLRSMAFVSNYN